MKNLVTNTLETTFINHQSDSRFPSSLFVSTTKDPSWAMTFSLGHGTGPTYIIALITTQRAMQNFTNIADGGEYLLPYVVMNAEILVVYNWQTNKIIKPTIKDYDGTIQDRDRNLVETILNKKASDPFENHYPSEFGVSFE